MRETTDFSRFEDNELEDFSRGVWEDLQEYEAGLSSYGRSFNASEEEEAEWARMLSETRETIGAVEAEIEKRGLREAYIVGEAFGYSGSLLTLNGYSTDEIPLPVPKTDTDGFFTAYVTPEAPAMDIPF